MNHENPYTLTMQTTAAHAWDEGFEAGRIAERGRLAGEVTDVIDRLAAEAGSKRARTSQLHRIVTLDVAIEAVREGAACGVAASEARYEFQIMQLRELLGQAREWIDHSAHRKPYQPELACCQMEARIDAALAALLSEEPGAG